MLWSACDPGLTRDCPEMYSTDILDATNTDNSAHSTLTLMLIRCTYMQTIKDIFIPPQMEKGPCSELKTFLFTRVWQAKINHQKSVWSSTQHKKAISKHLRLFPYSHSITSIAQTQKHTHQHVPVSWQISTWVWEVRFTCASLRFIFFGSSYVHEL